LLFTAGSVLWRRAGRRCVMLCQFNGRLLHSILFYPSLVAGDVCDDASDPTCEAIWIGKLTLLLPCD